ncbi:MAG: MarR family winged helix-turn-helix transcriptional regulator [candidate division Zixibacteria bacterium]|nr:MarR family winged helix-turn-helix transcriptional regulator [candidate division Zixibacteria bacterium]MDH3939321.1 MarR family winged helix-turn-helix transcriptional regulator [candidate division Zixibacteria bacterium]MDH4032442.1 MarR family winged helix-turn-helix transcriptional regulator [candidate division Zixibacteria bacterium]
MSKHRNILSPPFGRTIGMTARAFKKRLSRNLLNSGTDITADQFITLMNVRLRNGLCQRSVTDILGCDKTKTTRIIDALEKRKLVTRVPDKVDRRQKIVHVTTKGRATCLRLQLVGETTQKEALRGVQAGRLKICRGVLDQVLDNLNRRDETND